MCAESQASHMLEARVRVGHRGLIESIELRVERDGSPRKTEVLEAKEKRKGAGQTTDTPCERVAWVLGQPRGVQWAQGSVGHTFPLGLPPVWDPLLEAP